MGSKGARHDLPPPAINRVLLPASGQFSGEDEVVGSNVVADYASHAGQMAVFLSKALGLHWTS